MSTTTATAVSADQFTDEANQFTVEMTAKGVTRVHRASCKRQGDARPLGTVDPSWVAEAKPATCCRPGRAAAEHIAYAKELLTPTLRQQRAGGRRG